MLLGVGPLGDDDGPGSGFEPQADGHGRHRGERSGDKAPPSASDQRPRRHTTPHRKHREAVLAGVQCEPGGDRGESEQCSPVLVQPRGPSEKSDDGEKAGEEPDVATHPAQHPVHRRPEHRPRSGESGSSAPQDQAVDRKQCARHTSRGKDQYTGWRNTNAISYAPEPTECRRIPVADETLDGCPVDRLRVDREDPWPDRGADEQYQEQDECCVEEGVTAADSVVCHHRRISRRRRRLRRG